MNFGDWRRWFFVLLVKEFKSIFIDKASRFVLIGPIIIQVFLFGYAATFNLNDARVAVLNESKGQYSQELIAKIDGSPTFRIWKHLQSGHDMAEALNPRNALAIVRLQSNFDALLSQGKSAPVQIIVDGRNSTTAGMAAADLARIIQHFNQTYLGKSPSITIETRAWYNPNLITRWNIVTSLIATLSFIQVLILSALSIAREREQGTFDQLLVTPYRPFEILAAKSIPPILIGIVQALIVVVFARFWFDIPFRGHLPTLLFGLFVFTLSTVGIGLAISAISQTMQQAMIYSFVFLVPMVILSGLLTPVYNMPEYLQILTYANPLRFAVEFVHSVYLENIPLGQLWDQIIPMIVIAVLSLPFAGFFFRRSL